jgi:hypothetical protein
MRNGIRSEVNPIQRFSLPLLWLCASCGLRSGEFDRVFEVGWQWRSKMPGARAIGKGKLEAQRVQHLPTNRNRRTTTTVDPVANDWAFERSHVNSDLVGPSGLRQDLEQAVLGIALAGSVCGSSLPGLRRPTDGKSLAVPGIAGDGSFNYPSL